MPSTLAREDWWNWQTEDTKGRATGDLEELAGRCVVLSDLPNVTTVHTLKAALEQFGTVMGVKLVKNPRDLQFVGVAIVEMRTKDERDQVIGVATSYLFMLGAKPRPARAIAATPMEMIDHPWRRSPNKIKPRLVSKTGPEADLMRERERIDRLKIDDAEVLQRHMEQEEAQLQGAQESRCETEMAKFRLIYQHRRNGAIQEASKLHDI